MFNCSVVLGGFLLNLFGYWTLNIYYYYYYYLPMTDSIVIIKVNSSISRISGDY